MKTFDGRTILQNALWDAERMLGEQKPTEEVIKMLETKIRFIKKPPRWMKVEI